MADAWVSSVPTKSSTTSAPAPFVALTHRVRDVRLCAEHLVRAEVSRELSAPLVRVDPDDGRRPEGADELQRDVAHSSDSDDGRGGAGGEPRREPLHRVVRSNPSIGMRRDLRGLHALGQRDEGALVDEHVVREAAVAGEPREPVTLAEEVVAASARQRRART